MTGVTQFLSRDPAVATTLSPYAYVDGNPLNGVDPSGLMAPDCAMPQNADNPICIPGDIVGGTIAIATGVWSSPLVLCTFDEISVALTGA